MRARAASRLRTAVGRKGETRWRIGDCRFLMPPLAIDRVISTRSTENTYMSCETFRFSLHFTSSKWDAFAVGAQTLIRVPPSENSKSAILIPTQSALNANALFHNLQIFNLIRNSISIGFFSIFWRPAKASAPLTNGVALLCSSDKRTELHFLLNSVAPFRRAPFRGAPPRPTERTCTPNRLVGLHLIMQMQSWFSVSGRLAKSEGAARQVVQDAFDWLLANFYELFLLFC